MSGGLYLIRCSNGTVYVGSAKNLETRWKEHVSQLSQNIHFNRHLQRAWLKYGSKSFSYEVYLELEKYSKEAYFGAENALIEQLKSEGVRLFNIAKAQGGWGEETKIRKHEIIPKIKAGLEKHFANLTEEERKRKYGSRKGKSLPQNERDKLSNFWKGKKKSPETIERMKLAQSRDDPERRERMSQLGKCRRGVTPSTAKCITLNGITYPSGVAAIKALAINDRQLSRLRKGISL